MTTTSTTSGPLTFEQIDEYEREMLALLSFNPDSLSSIKKYAQMKGFFCNIRLALCHETILRDAIEKAKNCCGGCPYLDEALEMLSDSGPQVPTFIEPDELWQHDAFTNKALV